MVVGYARNTPHDQYFYDKPREMIAGEVPAPPLTLGNRDVIVRHLYAIAFGAANPGLSGKMVDYVAPNGTLNEETITALVEAVNLLGREPEPKSAGPVAEQLLREFARIPAKDQDTVVDFTRMLADKDKHRKDDK